VPLYIVAWPQLLPDDAIRHWTWLKAIPNVAQVLFYITLGVVTVLTYRQAKRTILQPLRTEVFKIQLEELTKVLSLFLGKDEIALTKQYDLDRIFEANCEMMLDRYAAVQFDVEVDRDERPYRLSEFPYAQVRAEYLEVVDDYISQDEAPRSEKPEGETWDTYQHGTVVYSKEFVDARKELEGLLESPVLPSKCAALIEEFVDTLGEYVGGLDRFLTSVSRELPEKYPTLDLLQRAELYWLENRYRDKAPKLKPKADPIVRFVRHYYGSDDLLEVDIPAAWKRRLRASLSRRPRTAAAAAARRAGLEDVEKVLTSIIDRLGMARRGSRRGFLGQDRFGEFIGHGIHEHLVVALTVGDDGSSPPADLPESCLAVGPDGGEVP
jgi:hypothetical protein